MAATYIEVNETNFEAEVLDRSRTVPVIVDFWAPWCGPCRTLGPILEELAGQAGGAWVLAKINSDENPRLAQAFRIRGIPAVKAMVDGQIVDEFNGALPRSEIQKFLERVVPTPAASLEEQAAAAEAEGRWAQALEIWSAVLAEQPENAKARLARARARLITGDPAGITEDLDAIPEEADRALEIESLRRFAGWADDAAAAGGTAAARERAGASPDQAEHRYALGAALAAEGNLEDALAEFLEVVRLDRGFRDDAGRKAMIAVFTVLGDQHELTRDYRAKLSSTLY